VCVTGRRVQGGEARGENLLELSYTLYDIHVSPPRGAGGARRGGGGAPARGRGPGRARHGVGVYGELLVAGRAPRRRGRSPSTFEIRSGAACMGMSGARHRACKKVSKTFRPKGSPRPSPKRQRPLSLRATTVVCGPAGAFHASNSRHQKSKINCKTAWS